MGESGHSFGWKVMKKLELGKKTKIIENGGS